MSWVPMHAEKVVSSKTLLKVKKKFFCSVTVGVNSWQSTSID